MSVTLAVVIGVAIVLVPSIIMYPSEATATLSFSRTQTPKPDMSESSKSSPTLQEEGSRVTSYDFFSIGFILSSGLVAASLIALLSRRKIVL